MSFTKPCGPCRGNGYYYAMRHWTCTVCEGRGELALSGSPEDYVKCGPCDGNGYYYAKREHTCTTCKGTGLNRKLSLTLVDETPGGKHAHQSGGLMAVPAASERADSPENPLVLISHSSRDADLALALIDLLQSGLGLVASQIRCTSVDGYRLPAGVNTPERLRGEINSAKVLIGLLTPHSLSSTYVLFELGARWGAGLCMIPLLVGVRPEDMRGPHAVFNALSSETDAQLIQLVDDIGKTLDITPQSASSYLNKVRAVKRFSDTVSQAATDQPSVEMVYEGSVCWIVRGNSREGPYCPVCYENNHKTIHLNPGANKGIYRCGVCGNGFRTSEYRPY